MGRRIVVVSGKGGVGKTTIVAGLGQALSRMGVSVVLIDSDAGMSNLDSLMNVQGKIVFDLSDLMSRKCRIKQALIPDSIHENLYTIASNKAEVGDELSDIFRFDEITSKLSRVFDFVLIDAPAGASQGFKVAVAGADESLCVVTPHTASLRDADKIISVLNTTKLNTQIVINRMRGDLVLSHDMLSHFDIQNLFSKKIVGVIPECDFISIFASIGFNIMGDKECGKSFLMLADNICSDRDKIYDYKKPFKGFRGILRRKFRRV
jgi:septum site-determining protein MinD